MPKTYPQDLVFIRQQASKKEESNDQFRVFLENQDSKSVDEIVTRLNDEISPAIDCTICGNCCRSFMINVTEPEIEQIAIHKNIDKIDAIGRWVEKGSGGMMIMNTIPCHFLSENKCTIYNLRFEGCREFPHLHRPNFKGRYFSVMMNYAICPITYNVVEELKEKLGFTQSPEVRKSGSPKEEEE